MDAALFDESNPIMEWLNASTSEESFMSLEQMISRSRKRKMARAGRKNGKKEKRHVVDEEDEFLESENDSERDTPPGSPSYANSSDHGEDSEEADDLDANTSASPARSAQDVEGANHRTKRARKAKRVEGFLY